MIESWRHFCGDWNSRDPSAAADSHQVSPPKDLRQHQTMVAILLAQQKVSDAAQSQKDLYSYRQFMADIKTSSWHNYATQVHLIERDAGFDYEYLAHSRVCFKGSLNTLRSLPPSGGIPTARYEMDSQIVFRKLTQLKNMFADWTHLWVYLNALVTAHYLHHACPINDTGLRRAEPLLKNYKVQFDQVALRTTLYPFIPKLAYSVHKLAVGQYCSHNLSVSADEQPLMNIAVGKYQPVKLTVARPANEVDILIG
jgi:hypothetical protein